MTQNSPLIKLTKTKTLKNSGKSIFYSDNDEVLKKFLVNINNTAKCIKIILKACQGTKLL